MKKKPANAKIHVRGTELTVIHHEDDDFISLTDMVRNFDGGRALIEQWLKNKDTVLFLGVWEQLNHPDFKTPELKGIRNGAGRNSFISQRRNGRIPLVPGASLPEQAVTAAPLHIGTSRMNSAPGSVRNSSSTSLRNSNASRRMKTAASRSPGTSTVPSPRSITGSKTGKASRTVNGWHSKTSSAPSFTN